LLVDPIFKDPDSSGASVSFACLVFYFQIYGDFAGYSDIARGLSKLMGFELMRNFEHPTFAVNVMDFWRRWHISFMSWLRDYVYFSIGNKNDSEFKKNLNNLIVFFLSGLWHGATWTFVIWGTINGVIFVFYRGLSKIFPARREPYQNKIIDTIVMVLKIFITLVFIAIPLIYFRSVNMDNAWAHTKALFINWMGDSSHNYEPKLLDKFIKNIALLILIEIHQFKFKDEFSIFKLPVIVRAILYICLFYCVAILGNFSDAFIYFVF
jgi:D-alanyl-lipoteichoic acid acyltransferase DltB (MBOAT superfamily)